MQISQTKAIKTPITVFRRTYALSVGFKMNFYLFNNSFKVEKFTKMSTKKRLNEKGFSSIRQKPTQILL